MAFFSLRPQYRVGNHPISPWQVFPHSESFSCGYWAPVSYEFPHQHFPLSWSAMYWESKARHASPQLLVVWSPCNRTFRACFMLSSWKQPTQAVISTLSLLLATDELLELEELLRLAASLICCSSGGAELGSAGTPGGAWSLEILPASSVCAEMPVCSVVPFARSYPSTLYTAVDQSLPQRRIGCKPTSPSQRSPQSSAFKLLSLLSY